MSPPQRDQEKFYSTYRGRQSWIFHLAYMRSAKVKALRLILERNSIALHGLSVLDYGFGSGTFLRACDTSCVIAGVEVDLVNVEAVRTMLAQKGHDVRDIQVLDVASWSTHPLLADDRRYDLIVLSHVLEHFDDPVGFLRRISGNLAPGGIIAGLLPINERRPDENHKWVCSPELLTGWCSDAGLHLADQEELDHWVYYAQPLFHATGPIGRTIAQGVSFLLGLFLAACSPQAWFRLGRALRSMGAKPGQLAFLLRVPAGGR